MNAVELDRHITGYYRNEPVPIAKCGECNTDLYALDEAIIDEGADEYLCDEDCWNERLSKIYKPKYVRLSESIL
ncbi:hypothetical protein AZF04_09550 [Alkalihalobacillus trypoxylicola]|uniref:Uncharacterized protein n=1 Tax=Alkalihalobacillus trypoxylicola TaxID=519424 RepID=A0A161P7S6_9BACI|nr:hypothetical protein AZF04_09550 [Alkalihalobacillus trypoxylicola]